MTRLLTASLLLLVSVPALAQSSTPVKGYKQIAPAPPPPAEVDVAKEEILRRGNMVQAVGTVQKSTVDAIAESLQTPADDSGKWYITVVTQEACPPCEALKKAFATAPELRIWANPADQEKSWSHYQVRNIDDPTQAAWFKSVRKQIEKTPAIIIQPPRNNQFGDNSTTVEIIAGYDGDPAKLSDEIRQSIVTYVAAIQKPRNGISKAPPSRGFEQSTVPPFSLPSDPFEIDPNTPAPVLRRNQVLSIEQIQQAVQGVQGPGFLAPAEFVLSMLQTGVRTAQEVQQAWLQYLARRQPTPDPQPTPATPTVVVPVTPAQPQSTTVDVLGELLKKFLTPQSPSAQPTGGLGDIINSVLNAGSWVKWILTFFGLTQGASILIGGLQLWRSFRKATGGATVLDDATFKKLVDALQANTNATNLNNVVSASDQLKAALTPAAATAG